jgi:putative flippase GtrA
MVGPLETGARRVLAVAVQYAKFSCVGILATASHIAVFTGLIEFVNVKPLLANVPAFCVAVLASFFGHFNWTFKAEAGQPVFLSRRQRVAFARFITVALLGLGLNSLLVLLVVDIGGLSYRYAILPMAVVVPSIVFLISKFWAFRLV